MKTFKQIIRLTICLTIVTSCTKDTAIPNFNSGDCGTLTTLPAWTKSLTDNQLIGDWKITKITYGRGNGSTHYFDTIYYPNQVLKLSASGNGTLNLSTPINWTYNTVPNNFPKMTLIKINSLFAFPVNCIYNDSVDTYFQSFSDQRFFVTYGKGINGNWEQGYISFERQ